MMLRSALLRVHKGRGNVIRQSSLFSTGNTDLRASNRIKGSKEKALSSTTPGEGSENIIQSPEFKDTNEIINRLITVARPEMKLIIASAATLGVTSSITLILPYACGHVLDMAILEASGANDPGTFSPYMVSFGLFGLTGVAGVGMYARSLMLNIAGNRIVSRMRRQLFASILSQEIQFFEKMKTGDLISRLANDTYLMKSAVTNDAVAGLRAIVMSIGSTGLLFHTSPSLAVVSLMSIPPVFVGARIVGRKLREKQKEVQELHGQATSAAEETLNAMTTVQQFVTEKHEHRKYSEAIRSAHDNEIEVGRTKAFLDGTVHVLANGSILGVLGYGGSLVLAGEMSAGDLTGFLMYSLLMAGNISSLSSTYAEMMKSFAAAGRTFEIIDRKPEIPSSFREEVMVDATVINESETAKKKEKSPIAIQFKKIHFSYPTRSDLSILGPNFNLTIDAGEVVAIVGSSGSGKSTIAAILTRLYDVDSEYGGNVLIDGVDISKVNSAWLRNQVGVVAQEPLLFAGTIAENIRYGRLDASDEEVKDAAKAAHVLEFTESLPEGLETEVGSRGLQLSGGQKQRVAIARMILKDPPVVILDEATSALDSKSEFHVHQALRSIMKGRTVISIAHRLSTIQEADRIAVLQDGLMKETGSYQELIDRENSVFKDLMKQQIQ